MRRMTFSLAISGGQRHTGQAVNFWSHLAQLHTTFIYS